MQRANRALSLAVLMLSSCFLLSAQSRSPQEVRDGESLTQDLVSVTGSPAAAVTESASTSRMIRYAGSIAGLPDGTGSATLTFSFYSDGQSSMPLWSETQTVTVRDGKYSALLGISSPGGLPAEIFSDESARWLGVSVNGSAETSRALLVSVPYAMKALEAERIAGHDVTEFITQADLQKAVKSAVSKQTEAAAASRGQDATSGGTPAGPTDFTGSNASEVVIVVQSGTGYAINAVANSNIAIRGVSHAAGIAAIQGENDNASGIGLAGVASGATGLTIGLLGQASSTSGRGLRGVALSTTGPTVGVQGVSNSPDGAAIQGDNLATTGIGLGVRGVTNSTSGKALVGLAQATTGASTALEGQNASTGGTAIFANSTATSGSTFGLLVRVASPNATAARLETTSTSGTLLSALTNGTQRFRVDAGGYMNSTNAGPGTIAIEGNHTGTGNFFYFGVSGTNASDRGAGVFGQSNANPGNGAIGVQGLALGSTGVGVQGDNTHTTGTTIGVLGVTRSPNGYAGIFRNRSGSGRIVSFQINNAPATEVAYVNSDGSVHAASFHGDGSNLTGVSASGFSGSLVGDVTGTQGATVVASVGGQTAANVASATTAANAATNSNTASTIVKRDSNGDFSAGNITADTGITVNGSVGKGSGIRHFRFPGCTTASTVGSSCSAPISPYDFTDNGYADFPDTNYTLVCMGEGTSGRPLLVLNSKTATDVQMTIINETGISSSGFTSISCIAMHD